MPFFTGRMPFGVTRGARVNESELKFSGKREKQGEIQGADQAKRKSCMQLCADLAGGTRSAQVVKISPPLRLSLPLAVRQLSLSPFAGILRSFP